MTRLRGGLDHDGLAHPLRCFHPLAVATAILFCWLPGLLAPAMLSAQQAGPGLSGASLEDLTRMQISVSSFARKDEDLWQTPAAVFVITKEDIARSAVSSIPELLRMVPGMQVAQVNASSWAVSARGFNSIFASKLLVLIDGRTVYSEIYAGTHWDQIDLPLEDIERIEVIRGPGAAVWGTDAVNGVVNIISKRARSTQGVRVSAGISRIGATTDIRYGGPLGRKAQYRAFASYVDRQPLDRASGQEAYDGEDIIRSGGRIDWQRSLADEITTSGDLYGAHFKQHIFSGIELLVGSDRNDPGSLAGGYLLSRWQHKSDKGEMALQVYFSDDSRNELANYTRSRTTDIDYQDATAAGPHNDLVWGGEFRYTANHITGNPSLTLSSDYDNYLVDGFLQDEISLVPKRLIVTLGSKIQQGALAGFQVQPSARILWAPNSTQSLWAAVSRAAVAPSLDDEYVQAPIYAGTTDGLPITGFLEGNPHIKPETVVSYEAGYRRWIARSLSMDLSGFYGDNRRLQSTETVSAAFAPTPTPHIQLLKQFANGFRAKTDGAEASLAWKPSRAFALQASYTWMEARTTQVDAGSIAAVNPWNSPRNSASASASWRFAGGWSANGFLSHIGRLADSGGNAAVPSYTRLDLHLARTFGRHLQIDAGATNLLTPRHLEFENGTSFVTSFRVPRSAMIKGTWAF